MHYPIIRNNNSLSIPTRRTYGTMSGGFQDDINEKTLLGLQDILSKLSSLETTQNELIRLLAPLFARSTETESTIDAINAAAMAAQEDSTASMLDANMRGDRFISKVMPQARGEKSSGATPSNPKRIMALLVYLQSLIPEEETNGVNVREAVAMKYDTLKASARIIRQRLFTENPELRGISWKKFGEKYPSLQKRLTLELERMAFKAGINIHYCLDMWCSDRLMFDSFRGSSKRRGMPYAKSNNCDNASSTSSNSSYSTSSSNSRSSAEAFNVNSPTPPFEISISNDNTPPPSPSWSQLSPPSFDSNPSVPLSSASTSLPLSFFLPRCSAYPTPTSSNDQKSAPLKRSRRIKRKATANSELRRSKRNKK